MRYLFAVIDNTTGSGTPDEAIAIDAFNEQIELAGQRLLAAGLVSPSEARLIDNRRGAGMINSGPAVESTEYMSGFWIIEAHDDETAEKLALQASLACNRKVEVRRFLR